MKIVPVKIKKGIDMAFADNFIKNASSFKSTVRISAVRDEGSVAANIDAKSKKELLLINNFPSGLKVYLLTNGVDEKDASNKLKKLFG